jgi:hypothetical protein
MKFRYILGIALSAFMFVACTSDNDPLGTLENIQIDQTFVTIPTSGGDVTVTIKSADDWSFDNVFEVDKVKCPLPAWLTATATSGSAGETKVTFHAELVDGGREAAIQISAGDKKQFLTVRQGSLLASEATCAEIIAGVDGKNYRVTGTCTSITNTQYGNWLLNDGTGEITIYGTADKNGKLKNYPIDGTDGWKFEPGDVITVEGPRLDYNGTGKIELLDVTVIKVVKSLLKLPVSESIITPDAQEVEVKVAYKGSGAYANIPDNAKSWVTYLETKYIAGVKTIFEKNPADTAVVKFAVAANNGATRAAAIEFSSSSSTGSTTMPFTLTQSGMAKGDGTASDPFNVVALTEFASKLGKDETADKMVYVTGKISKIDSEFDSKYGNATYYISDDGTTSGQFEVYRGLFIGNKKWADGDTQIKVGDEVVICGTVTNYKGTLEFASGKSYIVSLNGVTGGAKGDGSLADPFNIAGAIAAVNSGVTGNVYVEGIVSKIADGGEFGAKYGNGTFWISDDGAFYNNSAMDFEAYRVLWLGNKKWVDGDGQVAVGDKVVLCGEITKYKSTYETNQNKAYVYSINGKTE